MTLKTSHKHEIIEDLSTQLKAKKLELSELLQLTKQVNSNTSEEDLFKIYYFTLRALYQVQSMAIMYNKDEWELCFSENISKIEAESLKVNDSWRQFEDVTLIDHTVYDVPKSLKWVVPVKHKDNSVAFIFLDDFSEGYVTNDPTTNFIVVITNFVVTAIENKRLFKRQLEQTKMKTELKTASKIQEMLLPSAFPKIKELEISATYKPFESVGGDYYDVFPLSEEEYMICIADVSGKNVSAALLMSNFQAMLKANTVMKLDLPDLVTYLNDSLFSNIDGERFITAVIGTYTPETSCFEYVSAGHEPFYYIFNDEVKLLNEGCSILGIQDELKNVKKGKFTFESGAYAIFYTDGLTDCKNENNQNYDPLPYLKKAAKNNLSPQQMIQDLQLEIDTFTEGGEVIDDLTILILRKP